MPGQVNIEGLDLWTDDRKRSKKKGDPAMWDGHKLDSDEEYLFLCWCREAAESGWLQLKMWQPQYDLSGVASYKSYFLKKKELASKDSFLLAKHVYTADAIIELTNNPDSPWQAPMINKLIGSDLKTKGALINNHSDFVIDVKGGYGARGSDAKFSVNQKWVYAKHGVYVNKVKIMKDQGFFSKYWAPEEALFTSKGNKSKVYKACRTLAEAKLIIKN